MRLAAALVLTGCSMAPALRPPVTMSQTMRVTPGEAAASQPDTGASWIAAGAASSGPLLFLTDFRNYDVYVYTVPKLKMVERITGFFQPQGECSDAHGNVWITNTGAQQILEFRPGSKRPIATLSDSRGYPAGCAINLRNGDLAVTDIFDVDGSGGVLVFRNARGTPKPYLNPEQYYYYFAGYDDKGNLYASGQTASSNSNAYILSVLPVGGHTMSTVEIHGAQLYFPGEVFRSGSSIVLGDQECGGKKTSCLYETRITAKTATVTKKIALTGSCDVAETALTSNAGLFGGDYCPPGGRSTADRWRFPEGGKPLVTVPGNHDPIGAAIVNP
ncbi:MAG TPA: hypothetical protein VGI19_04060 [Candidatus Cybelea sp.]